MKGIYNSLSGIGFLRRSYTLKFLFVAFLGIHIPLIGLIVFVMYNPALVSPLTVTAATLIFTLAATGITLYILKALLKPLQLSRQALDGYISEREVPALPREYADEAGILMQGVQTTIETLDQLLEEKKDLVGFISHDLRTPLATLVLLGKQLDSPDEMDTGKRRYLASMIVTSASEQIALFKRVLELLRTDDARSMRLQLDRIAVSDIVQPAIRDLGQQAAVKNIRVHLSCSSGITVNADRMLLSQVLKNLLGNAIKFSHAGSEVHVAVSNVGDRVRISVSDNGTGFHPDDAPELFKRFTPKRRAGTAAEVSTGMGLYLSKKLVRAHNGNITAASGGRGKGSVFTVEL